MSELIKYVQIHTVRGECQCGRCIDKGNASDPEGHTVNMTFFKVGLKGDPDKEALLALIKAHRPSFGDAMDLFDGKEHNYIEIGGWIGDQGLAITFMGLGYLLGLWTVLTPDTMLPKLPDDLKMSLAQRGLCAIQTSTNWITGSDLIGLTGETGGDPIGRPARQE